MSNVSKANDGYRYLLNCIDVFSRFAYSEPMKTKTAVEVTDCFENKILRDRSINFLQSDKGGEFLNSKFQALLKVRGIRFYTSENDDIKAALVERFNRTLKERLYRYMTYKNTNRYVDVLPQIMLSYNNSYHRSIGRAPIEVNDENRDEVADRLYPPKPKKFKWKYRVGQTVRLSTSRMVFRKGYLGSWSEEIFTVTDRYPTVPVTYGIKDAAGEPVKGKMYELELQAVDKPADDFYLVERVLRTRRRGGKVEHLVKWLGYPESMNSWVEDVRRV
jgi:hypothetical protein